MMCYAFLGLWSALESVATKKAIGRVFENFIRLLYDNRASRIRKLSTRVRSMRRTSSMNQP
jgi:HAMP domain-containing protein